VFSTEIAKRKIVMAFGSTEPDGQPRAAAVPLHGSRIDLQAQNVAAWLGKRDRGQEGPVRRRPRLQTQAGSSVCSTPSPRPPGPIDLDRFNPLAKQGVPKLAVEVAWSPPADSSSGAQTSAAQEQATTLVAKLKDAGATSVILMGSSTIVGPVTKAATANEYSPEWLMTAWAYQDLSLFASQYDQDQWGHAFGMTWFAPYASDQAGAVTAENVVNWYWGTNKGTSYSGGMPAVYFINQGVQPWTEAAPTLSATRFATGSGALQDRTTQTRSRFIRVPEYRLLGPRTSRRLYDPKAEGPGPGNKQPATTVLDGGKRYTSRRGRRASPSSRSSDRRRELRDIPAKDVPPIPKNCPSQGKPSQSHATPPTQSFDDPVPVALAGTGIGGHRRWRGAGRSSVARPDARPRRRCRRR
jgi:hypothetical protein